MIAFHGSPNYFSKFNDNKIGMARHGNYIEGHFFSVNISYAYAFTDIIYAGEIRQAVFTTNRKNNITGYLYACEIPDRAMLLDTKKRLSEQSKEVQDIICKILRDKANIYISMNSTGREFIRKITFYFIEYYRCNYNTARQRTAELLSSYGLKGCICYVGDIKAEEIIIFDTDDIKIKQCFRVDRVEKDSSSGENFRAIVVLFKRFGEYYFAFGSVIDDGLDTLYFCTDDNCPEILDEIQGLQDLEKNQYVISYSIFKRTEKIVSEANFKSLNFVPNYLRRQEQEENTEKLFEVSEIQAQLDKIQQPEYLEFQKVVNEDMFKEYQEYIKLLKGTIGEKVLYLNYLRQNIKRSQTNTLFLQLSSKPWFKIKRESPELRIEEMQKIKELENMLTSLPEQKHLSEEELQEKTKEFFDKLKPIIQEKAKEIFNLPDFQVQGSNTEE